MCPARCSDVEGRRYICIRAGVDNDAVARGRPLAHLGPAYTYKVPRDRGRTVAASACKYTRARTLEDGRGRPVVSEAVSQKRGPRRSTPILDACA